MVGKFITAHKTHLFISMILIIVIFLSCFVFYPIATSVDTYANQIKSLDEKRNTVLGLALASSSVSIIITAIPDDVGTPIAEQIASLSSGFLIVLMVIAAEKYLLTLFGALATRVLIPLICLLAMINTFKRDKKLIRGIINQLIILCLAVLFLVPSSIFVSDMIEKTNQASIKNAIEQAMESEDVLNEQNDDGKIMWKRILKISAGALVGGVTGALAGAAFDSLDDVGKAVAIAKSIFCNFMVALAIVFVTNCIIPLLVLFIFLAVIRYVFRLNLASLSKPVVMGQLKKLLRHT